MDKTCNKCGETKPLVKFALSKGTARRNICKVCMDQHKDWKFQEQEAMDQTREHQKYLSTYRVNGGECDLGN